MRAPARLFIISFVIFVALMLFLSRFQSDTFTNTINKFPKIKEAYQARAAAVQSRLGSGSDSGSSTSSSAACDADSKSCTEPYTSKDSKGTNKDSEYKDQTSTSSEYEKGKKQKDKDRRPSTKDDDRDADRGFTDAEQAAALERLEYKYGEEAKDKADAGRLLWMETTTTTGWDAERTEALDPEAEKARKILGEEYGDSKATSTISADDADETPMEKGWRTTGFETKAKTAQKSLISGGGGNGTSTKSSFATGSATKNHPTTATVENTSTSSTSASKSKGKAKGKGRPKYDEDEELASSTSKGRWDDEVPEPTRAAVKAVDDAVPTSRGRWDDLDEAEPTSKKGRWDD